MVVLGSMSLGGNIIPVENLAESLQVAHDAGAKRVLLPMASVNDIPTIPGERIALFPSNANRPSPMARPRRSCCPEGSRSNWPNRPVGGN